MDLVLDLLAILIIVGAGLIAGVFLAFSSFVMRALARVRPANGAEAMQQINITVINPVFLVTFMGTTALSLISIAVGVTRWHDLGSRLLTGAGLLYFCGTFLVTALGNVPLNNRLAPLDPESPECAETWAHYLVVWTRWNHVRTVSSALATIVACLALLQ